jgi:hypothetical protein
MVHCATLLGAEAVQVKCQKLERMRREVVASYLKVATRYTCGESEESQDKPQDNRCFGRDSNRKTPELKSEPIPF